MQSTSTNRISNNANGNHKQVMILLTSMYNIDMHTPFGLARVSRLGIARTYVHVTKKL